MRLAIPLLALAALLSACHCTDQSLKWPEESEIRRFLVGKWASENPKIGNIIIYADGRFEIISTNSHIIRGTWQDFRPDGSVIRVDMAGSEPAIYTIRHVEAHLLVMLPPFETVVPPQKPLRFTR